MAGNEKKLDKEKFMKAYILYLHGKITQAKAAEIVGCSTRTFLKYANMIFYSRSCLKTCGKINKDFVTARRLFYWYLKI